MAFWLIDIFIIGMDLVDRDLLPECVPLICYWVWFFSRYIFDFLSGDEIVWKHVWMCDSVFK